MHDLEAGTAKSNAEVRVNGQALSEAQGQSQAAQGQGEGEGAVDAEVKDVKFKANVVDAY